MDESQNLNELGTSYLVQEPSIIDGRQIRSRETAYGLSRLQRIYGDLLKGEPIHLGVFDDTRYRASLGAQMKGADPDDLAYSDSDSDYLQHNLVMRRDRDFTELALVLPRNDVLVTSIDTLVNGSIADGSDLLFVSPTPSSARLLDIYVTQVASTYGMDLLKDAKVPADFEDQ